MLNALSDTLGPYARPAAPGLLMAKRGETHPTEVADLDGARLVVAVEADDGRRLAEAHVKQLTGGDRLKARRMRRDFYEFEPTAKIWLLANDKPVVRGGDIAIWRRVKLIPFSVVVPPEQRDSTLRARLQLEAAGILNWIVAGCLAWQRDGLQEPDAVLAATEEYRQESDVLAPFLDARCMTGDGLNVRADALYRAYRAWASAAQLSDREIITQTAFGRRLGKRFRKARDMQGSLYEGVALRRHNPTDPTCEPEDMQGSMQGFDSSDQQSQLSALETPREALNRNNPSEPYTPDMDDTEARCERCRSDISDDPRYTSTGETVCPLCEAEIEGRA
jgi:putative DNA primase/helicase